MNDFPNKSALDAPPSRRTDLDALRGVAMILGIVLHALLSFIPTPWPVQDTCQNGLFFIPYAAITPAGGRKTTTRRISFQRSPGGFTSCTPSTEQSDEGFGVT